MMVNKSSIIRLRLTIIFILAIILCFFTDKAKAEFDLDFEVPIPENSELLATPELRLLGQDMKGITYRSPESEYRIVKYYQNFFRKEGFEQVLDKMLPKDTARRIQFKKENFVVDIVLAPKDDGTEVGILKYSLPEGASKIEDLTFSVDDSIFSLPKGDLEGEDFEFIPRPPQSIRLSDINAADQRYVTYSTKLSVSEAVEFYKSKMYFEGWQLRQELDTGRLIEEYKKRTNKNILDSIKLKFPFKGGGNIREAMSQSYILDYEGSLGYARISIMPNIITKGKTTVVQISYSEAEHELTR
jgi:hypothetical protein